MNNNKIEESLARSVSQLPHPEMKALAVQPVQKMQQHDWITLQAPPAAPRRNTRRMWQRGFAFAALAVTIGSVWFYQYRMVDSIISLDVNPGFEISTNRQEQVLSIDGVSREARQLLVDRDYRGEDIEDTIEMLVEDLARDGYLTSEQNAVLLSISDDDAQHSEELRQTLSDSIALTMLEQQIQPDILYQQVEEDDDGLRERAHEQGISFGKQQLIDRLIVLEPALTAESLSAMPISELMVLTDRLEELFEDTQRIKYPQKPSKEDALNDQNTDPGSSLPQEAVSSEVPASSQVSAPVPSSGTPSSSAPAAIPRPSGDDDWDDWDDRYDDDDDDDDDWDDDDRDDDDD